MKLLTAALLVAAMAVPVEVLAGGGDGADPVPAADAPVAPASEGRGAVVVAVGAGSSAAAKALARGVYARPALRPPIDETMARVLAGDGNAGGSDAGLAAAADTVAALGGASPEVLRRLAASLGKDLGAGWVVLVETTAPQLPAPPPQPIPPPGDQPPQPTPQPAPPPGEGTPPAPVAPPTGGAPPTAATATARVVHVAEARVLSLELHGVERAASWDWGDAVTVLEGLLPAAAAPVMPPAQPAPPLPGEEQDEIWESPWFWVGIGAAAALGITVFALSKTALNEPDTVLVQGRISM